MPQRPTTLRKLLLGFVVVVTIAFITWSTAIAWRLLVSGFRLRVPADSESVARSVRMLDSFTAEPGDRLLAAIDCLRNGRSVDRAAAAFVESILVLAERVPDSLVESNVFGCGQQFVDPNDADYRRISATSARRIADLLRQRCDQNPRLNRNVEYLLLTVQVDELWVLFTYSAVEAEQR